MRGGRHGGGCNTATKGAGGCGRLSETSRWWRLVMRKDRGKQGVGRNGEERGRGGKPAGV